MSDGKNGFSEAEGITVLSLFDGMSCGQLALQKLGIKVKQYYAAEIDKHAIQVTQHNFPNTIQLGDVTKVFAKDLPKIDLLIGGSPCQGFSFAGKQLAFDDPRSKLFFEFVRLKNECNLTYFMLENVKMKKEWEDVITEALGVKPIEITSAKFVPQARRRLYWTNIPNIEQPKQIEYNVKDFIEGDGFPTSCGVDRVFKRKQIFNTLTATYWKGIRGSSRPAVSIREGFLDTDREAHRMLTPTECERLQTVPDGYTSIVSDTQRYRMLGNGWTVDVIAHIFSFMTLQKPQLHKHIVMPSCLRMSLKTKWFEMTKAGIKTEDYREINDYWAKRLLTKPLDSCGGMLHGLEVKKFDYNIMTLGYPKSTDSERILKLEHKGIEIRTGNPEWGAEPNKLYFVITHGAILA